MEQHTGFPSDETLASFLDGKLDPETRRRVIEHMTTCDECYATVMAHGEAQFEAPAGRFAPPVRKALRAPVWQAAAAAVIVIVGIGVVINRAGSRGRGAVATPDMINAAPNERPSAGRLFDFPYHKAPSPMRGGGEHDSVDKASSSLLAAAAKAEEASNAAPSIENLHRTGVAYLLVGDTKSAVPALESALLKNARTTNRFAAIGHSIDVPLLNDLAAAYMASSVLHDRAPDMLAALEATQRASQLSADPATTWNRALVLESVSLPDAARSAWQDNLKIDSSSAWAKEARAHLEELNKKTISDMWDEARPGLEEAARSGRRAELNEVVTRLPQQVREWAEDQVFPAWAAAVREGRRTDAARYALMLHGLAPALASAGDTLVADAVAAIDAGNEQRLAEAHQLYAQARIDYDGNHMGEAMPKLTKARGLFAGLHSPYEHLARVYIAGCLLNTGSYKQTLSETNDLLRVVGTHTSYRALLGKVHWFRGVSRVWLGDFSSALDEYNLALNCYERSGESDNIAAINGLMASVYDLIGDRPQGWRLRLETLRMIAQVGRYAHRRPQTLAGAVRAARRDGALNAAKLFNSEELREANGAAWSAVHVEALLQRSELSNRLGESDAAEHDRARAQLAASSVPDEATRNGLLQHPDFVRLAVNRLSDSSMRLAAIRSGLEAAESTHNYLRRAELWLQLGQEYARVHDVASAAGALDMALAAMEEPRGRLATMDMRDEFVDGRRGVYDVLVETALQNARLEQALLISDRARARTLGDLVGARTVELSMVRQFLDSDAAIVYFTVLDHRLVIWCVTKEGISMTPVAISRSALERLVRSATNAIHASDVTDASLTSLHRLLFDSWLSRPVALRRLILVPDGMLTTLPFCALRDATGGYLVDSFDLSISPSLAIFVQCARLARERRDEAGKALFIEGTLDGTAELAGTKREIAAAMAITPESRRVESRALSKDDLLKDMSESALIHYAGHSRANAENPAVSALVMTLRGQAAASLTLQEIAERHLDRAGLVVLASCSSVVDSGSSLQGLSSIGRAFLAAGAPAVVGSLWPVDDAQSAILFTDFYLELRRASDPSVALSRVQRAVSRRLDPATWAAFQSIGNSIVQ